jgi:tetratricopeptide (TPR) repeat protein
MPSSKLPWLALVALLVLCFGLAARLDVWFHSREGSPDRSETALRSLLGDSRRLFANEFFVKADVYFHSGYYPGVFDNNKAFQTPHMAEDAGAMAGHNEGDETSFLGPPLDWIDRLSRKFYPSVHTHLDEGGATGDLGKSSAVREILPWLELSSWLDPNRIETYTATAYWLRERLGKVAEAEKFLRQGLRENPGSPEILYELGRVFAENKGDPVRAANLWEAALRNWQKSEAGKPNPNTFLLTEITSRLARVEKERGNYPQAVKYMEIWKPLAPHPEAVQKQIDDLRIEMASTNSPGAASAPRR